MNLSLLKLLVRYSDDYGCVDLSKVKSLYQGSSSLSSINDFPFKFSCSLEQG